MPEAEKLNPDVTKKVHCHSHSPDIYTGLEKLCFFLPLPPTTSEINTAVLFAELI